MLLSTRGFDQAIFKTKVEVQDFAKNNFKLFPNPVSDKLTIEGEKIVGVEILDLNGKVILKKKNSKTVSHLNFDVGSIPNGIFLVKTTFDNYISITKLLKQ